VFKWKPDLAIRSEALVAAAALASQQHSSSSSTPGRRLPRRDWDLGV
jgi:hypothetical protein